MESGATRRSREENAGLLRGDQVGGIAPPWLQVGGGARGRQGGGQVSSDPPDPVTGFVNANDAYARRFAKGDLPMRPKTGVTLLTCADSRVDPAHFLGLSEGEATVFRNAGGRVTDDFLRMLLITQMLGSRRVMVIHHTDCGLNRFSNPVIHERVRKELGLDASDIDFLPYTDVEQSVRDDVTRLRTSPKVRRDVLVTGHIYDVRTGKMSEVPTP